MMQNHFGTVATVDENRVAPRVGIPLLIKLLALIEKISRRHIPQIVTIDSMLEFQFMNETVCRNPRFGKGQSKLGSDIGPSGNSGQLLPPPIGIALRLRTVLIDGTAVTPLAMKLLLKCLL
ncbi:hypothetical protein BZL42_11560 [Pseudomonas indica]|nr:hypothetical protein BZL42_11560 [Pseudomonas indica]